MITTFDPTKFGAIPAVPTSSGGFDPNKFGAIPATSVATPVAQKSSFFGGLGNMLISSEKAVGNDLTAPMRADTAIKNNEVLNNSQFNTEKTLQDHINTLKASGKDSTHAEQALASIRANSVANNGDISKDVPEVKKSNLQGLGDVAGVGLDVLSAGSYGAAAKEAETGKLLIKGGSALGGLATKIGIPITEKVATPVAEEVVKNSLGKTLGTIAKKTAVRSGIGAGTGYAYDVSQNLQNGKTGADIAKPGFGALFGGVIPVAAGVAQAGAAITKDTAPKFINSLIKPKQADFSYGKDPGRTVSEMGITGNNLNDFANNIHTAKQGVGSEISKVYSNPENAKLRINATDEIVKIDSAIQEAAKGGKENQGIVTTLQNTKDALLYEHKVNADGVIQKVGTTPRDLSALSPEQVFDLKKTVADQTKFTGKPSDDKTVNSILKNIYGGLKEKLNTTVGGNNPEIKNLNQKYADLTSAELATRNRDAIVKRTDMINMPIKVGGATALITALSTGGAAVPALLAGASAAALDKAMSSTAVKTRIASWLGSESPSTINQILKNNPEIKEVLYRALPKFSSQIGN